MKNSKKQLLSLAMLLSCIGGGLFSARTMQAMEESSTISPQNMSKDQVLRELAGKVKKLKDYDIYVGAGYSAAGEPMFFGMQKLDSQSTQGWQDTQVWINYAGSLFIEGLGGEALVRNLESLNLHCDNQALRQEFKEKGALYDIELMDIMCPNKEKLAKVLRGSKSGILGFDEMIKRAKGQNNIYVAYVSTEPIVGPFKSKKQSFKKGISPYKKFEEKYPDIIISVGVEMGVKKFVSYENKLLSNTLAKWTEHRGIFKNPFYEIRGKYKNISMMLHGWASAVEKQIFNKIYVMIYPTSDAAGLLHRNVKPGDMYIGVDKEAYPYKDEELRKKFPPIKQEDVGGPAAAGLDVHSTDPAASGEILHIFDLNVLSKYYTGSTEKK